MFGITLEVKLIIAAVVLALCGAGVWAWKAKDKKIIDLSVAVATQKAATANLADTVDKGGKSAKATEATETKVATDTLAVASLQDATNKKVAAEIAATNNKYKAKQQSTPKAKVTKPATKNPDNGTPSAEPSQTDIDAQVTAYNTDISTELVNGLWETYCNGSPDSTSCKTQTALN